MLLVTYPRKRFGKANMIWRFLNHISESCFVIWREKMLNNLTGPVLKEENCNHYYCLKRTSLNTLKRKV
jgi:hypothetical protein